MMESVKAPPRPKWQLPLTDTEAGSMETGVHARCVAAVTYVEQVRRLCSIKRSPRLEPTPWRGPVANVWAISKVVLRTMSRRKGSAPGPDALTCQVLGLLGEGTAEVMEDILHQCGVETWETA